MQNMIKNNQDFWKIIDNMIANHNIIIDRAAGSKHPKWGWVYEVNYGYLDGTMAADGEGIDVWVGSNSDSTANAIICIIDEFQSDIEIKILIGCNDKEIEYVYNLHNKFDSMKGILIRR